METPPPDLGPTAVNTRPSSLYGNFRYFPGRLFPDFTPAIANDRSPTRLEDATPDRVIMQDVVRDYVPSVPAIGWNVNHASTGIRHFVDGNPSGASIYGAQSVDGANLGFYDGSVRWHRIEELDNLGRGAYSSSGDEYSKLLE